MEEASSKGLPGEGAFADALVDTSQSLICVLDRSGRILRFNRACEEATGWTEAEVVGRDAREVVIPPDEVEDFGRVLDEVWATHLPSPQVGHWLTRDGGRRLIAWANRPLLGEDGEPLYLVTAGLDLTERQRLTSLLEERLEEQEALRRVATEVAGAAGAERVFQLVCEEAGRLLGAESTMVARYSDATATIVARWNRSGRSGLEVGVVLPISETGVLARVSETGRPARWDRQDDPEDSHGGRRSGFTSVAGAPVAAHGRLWGALVMGNSDVPLITGTESRLGAFTELLSLAIASADAWERLLDSRSRLVSTADAERRRLGRNLHDGAQQRLVAIMHALRLARDRLESDPVAAGELLDTGLAEVADAISDLRELARGLHPAMLTERGLPFAIGTVTARSPVRVESEISEQRFPESVEAAIYYVVAEAMTNAAKHADATLIRVSVVASDDAVEVVVTDDGKGGAAARPGSGLTGLGDRVEALRGRFAFDSPPGGGTTIRARFPI